MMPLPLSLPLMLLPLLMTRRHAAMPLMLSPCHYALLYAIFSFSCRRHFAILRRWLIFFFFIFAD
jgi:hypothetical protein